MKPPYLMFGLALLAFSACFRKHSPPPKTEFYPVLITRESLERSVSLLPPKPAGSTDKLLYQGNYLFILEATKGVHVIDNTNLQNPLNRGFINIPGCMDISVKDNTLYADNAVDLVAINIATISSGNIAVIKRIKNTFPELRPPDNNDLHTDFEPENRPANTVIVAWEK